MKYLTNEAAISKEHKIWVEVLILLSIYFNNETLSNNLSTIVEQPCLYVGYYALLLLLCFILIKKLILLRSTVCVILFFVPLFIAQYIDIGNTNGYMLIAMNILIGYTISYITNYAFYKKIYVKSMLFLAIVSFICTYLMKSFLLSLPSIFPIVTNSAGSNFINAYFCYVMEFTSYYRNTSIFREPGVFATFLNIALMISIQDIENITKQQKKTIIILLVAIISTFSTGGYLAMIFILLSANANKRTKQKVFYLIIGAIFITVLTIFSGTDLIMDVLSKTDTSSSSFQYRWESVSNGFVVAFENPLIGQGILDGTLAMQGENGMIRYHNISTIITSVVYFGIIYAVNYLYALGCFCKRCLRNSYYILPFILLLTSQQLIYNPIIYTLIFFGINQKQARKNNCNW